MCLGDVTETEKGPETGLQIRRGEMRPLRHPPASHTQRSHLSVAKAMAKALEKAKAKAKGVGLLPAEIGPPGRIGIPRVDSGDPQIEVGTTSRGGGMENQVGTKVVLFSISMETNKTVAINPILDGEVDSKMEKEKDHRGDVEKDTPAQISEEIMTIGGRKHRRKPTKSDTGPKSAPSKTVEGPGLFGGGGGHPWRQTKLPLEDSRGEGFSLSSCFPKSWTIANPKDQKSLGITQGT